MFVIKEAWGRVRSPKYQMLTSAVVNSCPLNFWNVSLGAEERVTDEYLTI